MPIKYQTPVVVETPPQSDEAQITNVQIDMEDGNPMKGNIRFQIAFLQRETVDSEEVVRVVNRKVYSKTFAEVLAAYPTEFQAAFAAIKAIGHGFAMSEGVVPEGGTPE